MVLKVNRNDEKGSMEIEMNTVLNPDYMLSSVFHQHQILQDDAQYAGDSVNEHVSLEEANEYLAKKEIGQINNNL